MWVDVLRTIFLELIGHVINCTVLLCEFTANHEIFNDLHQINNGLAWVIQFLLPISMDGGRSLSLKARSVLLHKELKKVENHLFKPKLSAPNPLWAIASGLLLSKPVRNLPKAPGVQKWWEPFERHKKMVKACSMFGEETVMLKWTLMHLQQWSNTDMDTVAAVSKKAAVTWTVKFWLVHKDLYCMAYCSPKMTVVSSPM